MLSTSFRYLTTASLSSLFIENSVTVTVNLPAKQAYNIPRNRNVFTYFHKAYGVIGNWLKEKGMIVMLSFPSKKQASDWLILPEVKEAKWYSVTVTVNLPAKQAYKNNQIKVILRFVKTFLSPKSVLESLVFLYQ
jgi:hypothetical protein